jgi:NADPH:quinone reductase-like Zn-dependent oxidoreductase
MKQPNGQVAGHHSDDRLPKADGNVEERRDIAFKELIESGKVMPIIDRTYPLAETPEAIRYLEEGHAKGKVVITV